QRSHRDRRPRVSRGRGHARRGPRSTRAPLRWRASRRSPRATRTTRPCRRSTRLRDRLTGALGDLVEGDEIPQVLELVDEPVTLAVRVGAAGEVVTTQVVVVAVVGEQ